MKKYNKIQTVFKRDEGKIVEGDYSLPELEYLKDNEWEFLEKVDGCCIRVFWDGKRINFGGKSDDAQMPMKLLYKLQRIFYGKEDLFEKIFGACDVCLYGEGYGAGIAKGGGNYSKELNFVLFDVKVEEWWLERKNIEDVASKLDIDIVPIVGTGTLEEMVEMARGGFDSRWGKFTAEGIIAKPMIGLVMRNGDRLMTKIKHKDFGSKALFKPNK